MQGCITGIVQTSMIFKQAFSSRIVAYVKQAGCRAAGFAAAAEYLAAGFY
jgi:hypothetical protein